MNTKPPPIYRPTSSKPQLRLQKTALAVAFAPLLACSTFAYSDQGLLLEEVIIMAQKREQSLQDVGVSVTAFTGEQMRELGQFNAKDIAAQTPGVNFADAGHSMTNILNIRGVSQNDFMPHQESPNAIYVDQAYMSILPASNFSLFDMERVEVLRGPQGTLYGRNATGGLIHYVTTKPGEETEGFVDVTMGEYGQQRVEAAFGWRLAEGVRARLSGVSNKNDGWLDNSAGPDLAEVDTQAIRGQLSFDITQDSELLLSASFGDGEKNQGFGHTPSGFDGATFLEIPTEGVNFYGLGTGTDSTGYRDPSSDPTDIAVDGESFYKPELQNYNIIFTHYFENITLTSVTNYVDWEVSFGEDSDASPRTGINDFAESETQQFSQEIRLNGDTASSHWLAGLYYLSVDHKTNFTARGELGYMDDLFAVLGVTALGDIDSDPTFGQTFGLFDDLVSDFDQQTDSVALFGQVEVDLTEDLALTAGLRWTEDDKDYRFNSREFYAGFETTAIPALQVWGVESFDDSQAEEDWSGKLQLDWHVSADTLVYAGISKGIKAGGFNAPTFGGVVNEFEQETLISFEAGMKTKLADSARLNISLFHYDYQDYQSFSFVNLATRIENKDAAIVGAEVELVWRPAEGLDIMLGVSVLDGEVKDVILPGGQIVDNDLPMAAEYTYNGLIRKAWLLGASELALQLDYSYTDSYFSEALNNPSAEVDGHGVANARLSYGPKDGRWELALNVRNLADEDEALYHIPTGLGFSEDAVQAPRWVSAQFVYRLN